MVLFFFLLTHLVAEQKVHYQTDLRRGFLKIQTKMIAGVTRQLLRTKLPYLPPLTPSRPCVKSTVRHKHYGYPRYNQRLPNQPVTFTTTPRQPKTWKVFWSIVLGSSLALSGYVFYETVVNESSVYIPFYIVQWSRKPLHGELGGVEQEKKLLSRARSQLQQRIAVDETVGAVLGVPCKITEEGSYQIAVNAPGPSLVCLEISPLKSSKTPNWSYRQVARPLIWWLDTRPGSSETPEIDTIIQVGQGSQDVGEQGDTDDEQPKRKWWWDPDEQEIYITGTMSVGGPGPNCHSSEHGRSAPKNGQISFTAVKGMDHNDTALRFKRTVLTYHDDKGREVHQRLC